MNRCAVLAVATFVGALTLGAIEARGQGVPAPIDPATLVRRLGSPSYREREDAMRTLLALGGEARRHIQAALDAPDPEVRWRARFVARRASPADTYYAALALAEAGSIAEAAAQVREVLPDLPKGIRPVPDWVHEILVEVHELTPTDGGDLTRCIAWHNLMCLLLEAGIDCPRTIAATRREYLKVVPGNPRACRLLAVVEWEALRPEESKKRWDEGKPGEGEGYWADYDAASYHAARGELDLALEYLKKAIADNTRGADEADRASDFYMLRGEPRFEALVKEVLGDAKRPDAIELRWKGRRKAGAAPPAVKTPPDAPK